MKIFSTLNDVYLAASTTTVATTIVTATTVTITWTPALPVKFYEAVLHRIEGGEGANCSMIKHSDSITVYDTTVRFTRLEEYSNYKVSISAGSELLTEKKFTTLSASMQCSNYE